MNAKLIIRKTAHEARITIKRSASFKIMSCPAADLDHTVKYIIIHLSNLGYNVTVEGA